MECLPPLAKLGISFEEMANSQWFQKNPFVAWGYYGHRANKYRCTIPHKGFLKKRGIAKIFFVFTSNVGGQFQAAGFLEDQILECHGSIHHLQSL